MQICGQFYSDEGRTSGLARKNYWFFFVCRAIIKQEPNNNQTRTKQQPNRTKRQANSFKLEPNVNVNGNVNDNVSGGGGFAPPPLTTQQILPSKRVVGEGLWITSLGERCW